MSDRFCTQCGNRLSAGDRRCHLCGARCTQPQVQSSPQQSRPTDVMGSPDGRPMNTGQQPQQEQPPMHNPPFGQHTFGGPMSMSGVPIGIIALFFMTIPFIGFFVSIWAVRATKRLNSGRVLAGFALVVSSLITFFLIVGIIAAINETPPAPSPPPMPPPWGGV
ncbi:MAG: hypothetical protein FWE38_04755 [Firmicutes bacterium]|nr:hypothetical protein [Bacillota bacterium]